MRLAGTPVLSWRRLALLCGQLVRMPGTAVWRQLRGADADWTVEVALMARAAHTLEVANWQRGADAKEGRARKNFPRPILSPSQQEQEAAKKARPVQSVGRLLQFKKRTGYAEREA
jgi:hypothetical protein